MASIRPAGWPAPGPQDDGSYIEYIYPPRSTQLKSWRRHANYIDSILNGRGNNKQRLLARVWIATGGSPTDTAGFQAFAAQHSSRKWTFRQLHIAYDSQLAPEHRWQGRGLTAA